MCSRLAFSDRTHPRTSAQAPKAPQPRRQRIKGYGARWNLSFVAAAVAIVTAEGIRSQRSYEALCGEGAVACRDATQVVTCSNILRFVVWSIVTAPLAR